MNELRPPPRRRLLRETRAIGDFVRMCGRLTRRGAETVQGSPVMLLPGFGAGERAMQPLRFWLRRNGIDAEHWGLGRNLAGLDIRHSLEDIGKGWKLDPLPSYRGEAGVPLLSDRAGERVRARSQSLGQPLTLIGWSLGGTIAREIARDHPACVDQVITLGAPVTGGPKYTAAASRLGRRGLDLDWIERQVQRRAQTPIQVPVTAIISPTDAIVAQNAAIDERNPLARHVLLDVPHLGMAINPTVWDAVLEALSGTPGKTDATAAD